MADANKKLIDLMLEKEAATNQLNKLKDKANLLIENVRKTIGISNHV